MASASPFSCQYAAFSNASRTDDTRIPPSPPDPTPDAAAAAAARPAAAEITADSSFALAILWASDSATATEVVGRAAIRALSRFRLHVVYATYLGSDMSGCKLPDALATPRATYGVDEEEEEEEEEEVEEEEVEEEEVVVVAVVVVPVPVVVNTLVPVGSSRIRLNLTGVRAATSGSSITALIVSLSNSNLS